MAQLEYAEVQETTRSGLKKRTIEAVQQLGSLIENTNPGLFVGACGASIAGVYAYMYFVLPWVLYKHLLMDGVMLLMLPFLLAVFSTKISDMGDFWKYENLKLRYGTHGLTGDSEIHVWEAPKYYKYINSSGFRYMSMGLNFTEATSEASEVEEGTKTSEASEVEEGTKTSEASEVEEGTKTSEASEVEEGTKTSEASGVEEGTKTSEASGVAEGSRTKTENASSVRKQIATLGYFLHEELQALNPPNL